MGTVDERHCNYNEQQLRCPVHGEFARHAPSGSGQWSVVSESLGGSTCISSDILVSESRPGRLHDRERIRSPCQDRRGNGSEPCCVVLFTDGTSIVACPIPGDYSSQTVESRPRSAHVTVSMSGATRVQPSGSAGGRSPGEDARDGPARAARSGGAANAFAVPTGTRIGD